MKTQMFVAGKDGDLAEGHNNQLQRRCNSEYGTKRDQNGRRREVSVEHAKVNA